MAVIKEFDASKLYQNMATYKIQLAALDEIKTEIAGLRIEMNNIVESLTAAPNVVNPEELMNRYNRVSELYAQMQTQEESIQRVVAEAETNLNLGIDALQSLSNRVRTSSGYSVAVSRTEDLPQANIYLVNSDKDIVYDITLDMAAEPSTIDEVQRLITDLKEQQEKEISAAQEVTEELDLEHESNIEVLTTAQTKISLFARMKTAVQDINAKWREAKSVKQDLTDAQALESDTAQIDWKGKLREMLDISKNALSAVYTKLHINEYGDLLSGEYRSVQKGFSALKGLDDFLSNNNTVIKKLETDISNLTQELRKAERDKISAMSSKWPIGKQKRIDTSVSTIVKLEKDIETAASKVLEIQGYNIKAASDYVSQLEKDTLGLHNKTIGNQTIQISNLNDKLVMTVMVHGKIRDEISLNKNGRITADDIERVKDFRQVVKTLSPRSVGEAQQHDDLEQEPLEMEQSEDAPIQKHDEIMYASLSKLETLTSEHSKDQISALTKEALDAIKTYCQASADSVEFDTSKDGQITVSFPSRKEGEMHNITLNVGSFDRDIIDALQQEAQQDGHVYIEDASHQVKASMKVAMDYYRKNTRSIKDELNPDLARFNKQVVNSLVALNTKRVGDDILYVHEKDGYLVIRFQDINTNKISPPQVCAVGPDGKWDLGEIRKVVQDIEAREVREEKQQQDLEAQQSVAVDIEKSDIFVKLDQHELQIKNDQDQESKQKHDREPEHEIAR